jgi:hypothetical protein
VELNRNHFLSAGYVRNWAGEDGLVSCELLPEGKRLRLAPTDIGVRKKFYARSPAPDGVRSARQAEKARGIVETEALPLIRDLAVQSGTPQGAERAWIALWLGMTLCGSPWRRRQIPDTVARFLTDLERDAPALAARTGDQRGELAEPDFELDSMFEEVSTTASLLGQMHWTVLRFDRPELTSSDHPIVSRLWSRDPTGARDAPPMRLLESHEVLVTTGPQVALLLTWLDADDRRSSVVGRRSLVDALNGGSWAQAERHRFWHPDTWPRPPARSRSNISVTPQLLTAYDPRTTLRLDTALSWTRARYKRGMTDRDVVISTVETTRGVARVALHRFGGAHARAFSEFGL